MKKDKGEIAADIFYYGFITLMVGAVIAFIVSALVREFGG